MATTNVTVRMDEELKQNMEAVCQELGMNMTTAFTIFARKMTREHRIPFEVSIDPVYAADSAVSSKAASFMSRYHADFEELAK